MVLMKSNHQRLVSVDVYYVLWNVGIILCTFIFIEYALEFLDNSAYIMLLFVLSYL